MLHPDRCFDPDIAVRDIARELYEGVKDVPIVSPHSHADPRWFARNEPFPDPVALMIRPDHYIYRMLYSRGISLESMGMKRRDGAETEKDPRLIWQRFADHFTIFDGTPTGVWFAHIFSEVFGIEKAFRSESAIDFYDHIDSLLKTPEFRPRAMYERFGIELLSTTDAASDSLEHHKAIAGSDWGGRIIPCFRVDAAVDIASPEWPREMERLSVAADIEITSYGRFIQALEERRTVFREMGAVSTDHSLLEPFTTRLLPSHAEAIFQRALAGRASCDDSRIFTAHMVMEMARMSIEDGLVMQLHPGICRDHNRLVFERFGKDSGGDIPVRTEYTHNLRELLNAYGNDPRFTLILFTLDESAYTRELAPLAGHYPSVLLGPAWWFNESFQGMVRYRELVTETAGIYNTAGFNDDTRAFTSVPARHDLSRRVDCNFLAGLTARHLIDMEQARVMSRAFARDLAKKAYGL